MPPNFFQTVMGKRFLEGTIPAISMQVSSLNDNLEKLNINLEKIIEINQSLKVPKTISRKDDENG